jgi:hypothetical protein
MKKLTQKQRIVNRLLKVGSISRNECLRVYISRLGAIICDLTKEGWQFETKNENGDYVYKVVRSPFQMVTRTLGNGEIIKTYQLTEK